MRHILYSFRHLSWIAIICSILGALQMFLIGALKTYYAITSMWTTRSGHESLAHLKAPDLATTYLIKSLDAFLIAFVLLIFAYGVYWLFISDKNRSEESNVLSWIRMPNISVLKNVLAEVIIIILFVKFLEVALSNLHTLTWEILALPIAILLLSLALKLLDLKERGDKPNRRD